MQPLKVAGLFLSLLVACEPLEPIAQSAAALVGGQLDAEGAQLAVGQLLLRRTDFCTGSVVRVDPAADTALVLTAARCLFNPTRDHGWFAATPRGFFINGVVYPVRRWVMHPNMGLDRAPLADDPWPITLRGDLAFVEVANAGDLPVLPIARDRPPAVGDVLTLVGFGAPAADQRQVGTTRVAATHVFPLSGLGTFELRTADGAFPCDGDVGGPALLDGEIVAVASASGDLCDDPAAVHFLADVRDGIELYDALQRGQILEFTSCAACAGTSGICTETRDALSALPYRDFEACIRDLAPGADFVGCSIRYPEVRAAVDTHWACLQTRCEGLCTEPTCTFTQCEYSHDAGGPCDTCILEHCCEVAVDCVNDLECRQCSDSAAPDEICLENEGLKALYTCLGGPCDAACAPYMEALVDQVVPEVIPDAGPDAGPDAAADGGVPADGADVQVADAQVADAAPDAAPAASAGDDGCHIPRGGNPPLLVLAVLGWLARRRRWAAQREAGHFQGPVAVGEAAATGEKQVTSGA